LQVLPKRDYCELLVSQQLEWEYLVSYLRVIE
jgi:hypothetical protein